MAIQVQVQWIHGLQFIGRAGDGPAVVLDTAESGGGPSPMELMLMGVAGCTAMDVISILKKKRMKVHTLRVDISGDRAADYPKRYTAVHISYVVKGTDINPNGVEQAIDLSMNKYCGAMASLNAAITHSLRIEPSEPEA